MRLLCKMFFKTKLCSYIFCASLFYLLVTFEAEEEEEHLVVPECPLEYKEGIPICPSVTTGGSIRKLMKCAKKMQAEIMDVCKSNIMILL